MFSLNIFSLIYFLLCARLSFRKAKCCTTICLVESYSQDVHTNTGMLSALSHMFHVMLTSVVYCHRKRDYTCVLDGVSFIEILSMINLYTCVLDGVSFIQVRATIPTPYLATSLLGTTSTQFTRALSGKIGPGHN